jgi:hypothetical protein
MLDPCPSTPTIPKVLSLEWLSTEHKVLARDLDLFNGLTIRALSMIIPEEIPTMLQGDIIQGVLISVICPMGSAVRILMSVTLPIGCKGGMATMARATEALAGSKE